MSAIDTEPQGTGFTYEIPDCLMHRDFIEVHGVCLGKQVSFELCTKDGQAKSMPDVIPLQVILNTSGQVTVMGRNMHKVEKQELSLKNCIQENKNFELCVYAYEDKYEVFLNKEKICAQRHLVPLSDVFALSMDGDAEFLSVEFKDLYWEDEAGSNRTEEEVPGGFVRVQEMRESSKGRKGEQVMVPVRNSFRSSIQSKTNSKPPSNNEVSAWQTSTDLSKPYLDKDYQISKSSTVEAREPNAPQMYSTMPTYGTQRSSDYDPVWATNRSVTEVNASPLSKSKINLSGSKKSITLSEDNVDHRLSTSGYVHKGNYQPVDDQYPTLRNQNKSSPTLMTGSTPSLQEKSKKKRFSLLGRHRKSKGSEPDIRASVQQDQASDSMLRKSRASSSDVRSTENDDGKKKKKFSFKNIFKRKKSKESIEATPPPTTTRSSTLSNRPSYVDTIPSVPATAVSAQSLNEPKDLYKQPSPNIAGYLHNTNNYAHLPETNLTGRSPSDTGFKLRRGTQDGNIRSPTSAKLSITTDPFTPPATLNKSEILVSGAGVRSPSPMKVGKLKGSAPEMASILHSHQPNKHETETSLTEWKNGAPLARISANNVRDSNYSPVTTNRPIRISGNAPEMASQILRNNPRLEDDDIYYTNLSGTGAATKNKASDYEQKITIDRDQKNVYKSNAGAVVTDSPNYVFTNGVQNTRQAVSLPDYRSDEENNLSESSTVYTDGEYYLEVGKSAYYFERKRSLKNYRSRRSVKQEQAARRQMGLATGDSDSALSSISSLKPDDPKMTPHPSRRRIGAGTKEVRSWLNNQNAGYNQHNEIKVVPTVASSRIVYADAPSFESDKVDKYSTKDICETFWNKDMVEFPVPLITGRQAILSGSFINSDGQTIQSGLIKLMCVDQSQKDNTSNDNSSTSDLFIQIWSNGRLCLFTKSGMEQKVICTSVGNSKIKLDESFECQKTGFYICLTEQSRYFAITRDNLYTLIVPKSVLSMSPHAVKVEDLNSITLSELVVTKCLTLPLLLYLPPEYQGYHNLELSTKLTTDSEEISIQYYSEACNQNAILSLAMDLTKLILYTSHSADSAIRIIPAEIPFIPEQIKLINVILSKEMNQSILKVQINSKEIVNCILDPVGFVNQLYRVHINGDLQLVDAQLIKTSQ